MDKKEEIVLFRSYEPKEDKDIIAGQVSPEPEYFAEYHPETRKVYVTAKTPPKKTPPRRHHPRHRFRQIQCIARTSTTRKGYTLHRYDQEQIHEFDTIQALQDAILFRTQDEDLLLQEFNIAKNGPSGNDRYPMTGKYNPTSGKIEINGEERDLGVQEEAYVTVKMVNWRSWIQ